MGANAVVGVACRLIKFVSQFKQSLGTMGKCDKNLIKPSGVACEDCIQELSLRNHFKFAARFRVHLAPLVTVKVAHSVRRSRVRANFVDESLVLARTHLALHFTILGLATAAARRTKRNGLSTHKQVAKHGGK
ncbi:hypothetical protein TRVL_08667 [Trypanosoma vivax]|nr:hypothetical protein TRVL_08667 [Trypanosoma vivax]